MFMTFTIAPNIFILAGSCLYFSDGMVKIQLIMFNLFETYDILFPKQKTIVQKINIRKITNLW